MRAVTKADKERGDKLREIGCIVCYNHLSTFSPCEIHHIDGQAKKGCHQLTIGLCPRHHRIPDNNRMWVSLHHDGRAAFYEAYGPEYKLLAITNELIGE